MKRSILLVLVLALTPATAFAWQGYCRPTLPGTGGNLSGATLQSVICSADINDCEEGIGYARGRQLGEHTFMTREAMIRAGIPTTLIDTPSVFQNPMLGTATAGTARCAKTVYLR